MCVCVCVFVCVCVCVFVCLCVCVCVNSVALAHGQVSMTSGSIEDFKFAEETSSNATTSNLNSKPAQVP